MAGKSAIQKIDPALLAGFEQQAQADAQELAGNTRFTPPYLRIARVKAKGGTNNVVEIVNPAERDAEGNAKVTQFPTLDTVLLAHVMTRRMQYADGEDKGKLKTEAFSVGPKRGSVVIGGLVGGWAFTEDIDRKFPDGWTRSVIPYGTDQVVRENVKMASRYYAVFALPEEAQEAAGGPLAMAFMSMTSVYGIMIKKKEDADDRNNTLLAYPDGRDDTNKGVLHRLLSREWEFGQANGLEGKSTPSTAIWLNLYGHELGDSTQPVHAFEIGEELDADQLAWAAGLKTDARLMMMNMIEQGVRDVYPNFNAQRLPELSAAAADGKWDEVQQAARLALPVNAEVVVEDEELPESEDLEAAAPPPSVDDEFPPEESLPFNGAPVA